MDDATNTGWQETRLNESLESAARELRVLKFLFSVAQRKDLKILGVPAGKHMPENAPITQMMAHEAGSIVNRPI